MSKPSQAIHKSLTDLGMRNLDTKLAEIPFVFVKLAEEIENTDYVTKIGNRTIRGLMQTVYQTNGQVNTKLYKVIRIGSVLHELGEMGYLDLNKCLSDNTKLADKIVEGILYVEGHIDCYPNEHIVDKYAMHRDGKCTVIGKLDFEKHADGVKSGCWENRKELNEAKRLKALTPKKKFRTKFRADCNAIVLENLEFGSMQFVLAYFKDFDHKKFNDMHKGMSFEEVKKIVTDESLGDGFGWINQFKIEGEV